MSRVKEPPQLSGKRTFQEARDCFEGLGTSKWDSPLKERDEVNCTELVESGSYWQLR